MAFAGLRKEKDRASVILYLNSKVIVLKLPRALIQTPINNTFLSMNSI